MKTANEKVDQSVNKTKTCGGCATAKKSNWVAPVTLLAEEKKSNWIPLVPITTAEGMKANLVKNLIAEYTCVAPRLVFQAVNEAYALAALTGEPLLVLPVLAEEKVQNAATWTVNQRTVRNGGMLVAA